ncbi:hypothetical protein [Micropruina sonneratiae]|uniref:hypothetical protein n=1 Tax=Micropruina sonneratiae TaxID=2986940 RepID=UPI002225F3D7|nr:hypothetical protein [Micropruina sp. KQZ13P-5]MCW3156927.1 hypothetical protein [Micropruina sp. KQZ13P-5]
MTPTPRRRLAALAAPLTTLLLLAACQSPLPQPRTSISCDPGTVVIEVTNVGDEAARYTVSVTFVRAGDEEDEEYSSNKVEPGATATITDDRPDEPQTCRVTGVQVFAG